MPTDTLDHILAAKRQFLAERRAKTPIEAVIALADMQRKPQAVLNMVTGGGQVTLIGQIARSETYDPVAATLAYVREGVDSVSLFTDETVYERGLDDLLLVSRGVNVPVISQDYILDEYHVVETRAAGASALVVYSYVLDQPVLRKVVSVAQRWRMTSIVQVSNEEELAYAQSLSPHVLGINAGFGSAWADDIACFQRLRPKIPYNMRCMILSAFSTVDEVRTAIELGGDAIMISEALINTRGAAGQLRDLVRT